MTPTLRPLSVRARLTLWYTGVLLAILVVISALSYSWLRWVLVQDLDTSLLAVAQVVEDTQSAEAERGAPEALLRELLGAEIYEWFFRLMDPEGRPAARSPQPPDRLPLSAHARSRAAQGRRTFETLVLPTGERVRLLTVPVTRDGRVAQLLQVGMPLERTERAVARYVQSLLLLVPLGLALAAAGGWLIARAALDPVDAMSRAARRITGGDDLGARIAVRGTGDELDHLAGTLNAMLARLDAAFAEMRRFAADAAHELRTPLTVLRGEIEVALRAERPAPEYRRVLVSALEEVERLVRLAEDLLLLSRFAARVPAAQARVDLEPLVVEVCDAGVRRGKEAGVAVRLGELTPAVVVGEAAALRRAVLNLVQNAVKYTPAGGRVTVSLACHEGQAEVTIADTGVGIPPAETGRIFDPFVRLDAARARDTGGAGLGLTIARSIVLAHGGVIEVESRPGEGSRFVVRLPLA